MLEHLFAYGTLQVPSLLARVIGRDLEACAATLAGYARHGLAERPYPAIVELSGSVVDGVVYAGLTPADLARLDGYEGDMYERRELRVQLGGRTIAAYGYALQAEHLHLLTHEPWDLARFERESLERYLADLGGARP